MQPSFEQQLAVKYALLSAKLKEAANYVNSNPIDVATRSLRAISKDADLSPATFSRMSKSLGYNSYEELRDVLRRSMKSKTNSFSSRVEALQKRHEGNGEGFVTRHLLDCTANLEKLSNTIRTEDMDECVERLHCARRVVVLGALGSTGIAEHLVYMASFIADNWSLANRTGASLASGMVGLCERDVVIVITKPPFATNSIKAVQEAREVDAFAIVITDTHTCPALSDASASFIVPTDSQHFFSSYASTLVLTEIMMGLLASRAGQSARERIAKVEEKNRRFSEVWDG